ncbi:efflux RND transporter periplasmic adaptor subunit, partial [Roseisolibacter sp. H3M3-2]|uniref:efflux RND transporter periplasmic adaptor subunit n=1 Tax=Roseisolibacter sp. H3M3-2 TaxID=3031323 RepID=UPI0023DBC93A
MPAPSSSRAGASRRLAPWAALAALGTLGAVAACTKQKAEAAAIETAPVRRQTVVVDVEATGVITPMAAVEVRSKASGQIVEMPAQTGQQVRPGDLLVRVDPRDPQSRFDQARASLSAAQAALDVAKSQYDRNQALAKQGVITAPELEQTRVAYANAQSQLTSARTQLSLSRIALEDVTITAPSAGTVIAKNVSLGQVITSSTNSPSGGTVLLSIANLGTVYDSTLVTESDIGKVKPGQAASVTVDAYPGRTFRGVVEKIEPRATVQQSVTMFPVLIRIDNQDGALMPGMNSDVSILVDERDGVLAVPVDAVRPMREAATAAAALGIDPAKVQALMQQGRGGRGGAAGDTPTTNAVNATGAPQGGSGNGGSGNGAGRGNGGGMGGGMGNMPDVSPALCDSVTKKLAAKPGVRDRIGALRQQMQDGGAGPEAREQMRALYDSAGVDPRQARACQMQGEQGARGQRAGGAGSGNGGAGRFADMGRGARTRRGLVFVKSGETFEPRLVTLGLGNFDVTEVLSGLQEGENVALVSAAVLQQSRTEFQERLRSRSGLPGTGGGGGAPAGGGGGGRPGGGGGAPGGG